MSLRKLIPSRKSHRAILIILIFLTLFRIWLGFHTPTLLQADAIYDDTLYVNYSTSILGGHYLGPFSEFTFLKTISPSLLLCLIFLLGIPYSVFLTLGFTVAVIVFVYAFYQLTKSRKLSVVLYPFLLYSPVMFHEENVQKIYRGGFIVIFSLLVLAAIIGIYAMVKHRTLHRRSLYRWLILACISLPIFYYLKEDSIWIMPFVTLGLVISAIHLWKRHHHPARPHPLILFLPLVILVVISFGYKTLNYISYGEFAVTDRSGTNFSKVLNDLLKVDSGKTTNLSVWVSRDMIKTAAEHSDTLAHLMPHIQKSWDSWFGQGNEAHGDFYIWAFRSAVVDAGIYQQTSGNEVENYYAQIHQELQSAYDSGELSATSGRIYVSSVTRGYTIDELFSYLPEHFGQALSDATSYRHNITTTQPSTGSTEALTNMSILTNSAFYQNGTAGPYTKFDTLIAKIDNYITKVYQKTGPITAILGISGLIFTGLTIVILRFKHRKANILPSGLPLIVVGLLGSALILILAVVWFCNFLSDRKVYDYIAAAIPLLQVVYLIGIYSAIKTFRFLKK